MRTVEACLDTVAACDLYVAIVGWRYGYIPPSDNPLGLSFTELEYQRAVEAGKPRLIFVVHTEAAWNPRFIDRDRAKINAFRARLLSRELVAFFTSPETVEAALLRMLENLRAKPRVEVPASPEEEATIRSVVASPERVARLLASIVLADRSRLTLLESPNSAGVADALASQNAQHAAGVAGLIDRMDHEAFQPDPLWLSWITHIHRERLDEIGAELLRVSGITNLP